jgi:hypothetical protein
LTVQDACGAGGLCFEVLLGRAGGWQWPRTAGDNKQKEHAADDEGRDEEGKGGKGNDIGDEDGG